MPVFLKALSVLSVPTDLPPSPPLILCNLSTDLTNLLRLHSQRSPSIPGSQIQWPFLSSHHWFPGNGQHHKHLEIPFSLGFMALKDPYPCNTCLAFKVLSPLFFSLSFSSLLWAIWLILKQYAEDLKFFPPLLTSFLGFRLPFFSTFPWSPKVSPILQIQYVYNPNLHLMSPKCSCCCVSSFCEWKQSHPCHQALKLQCAAWRGQLSRDSFH